MLDKNDPEKNVELERSISHEGQREPAIITCEGFLINGNRRKMTLKKIKLKFMKVVILPGKIGQAASILAPSLYGRFSTFFS